MMRIDLLIAIDPGSERSALIGCHPHSSPVGALPGPMILGPNREILSWLEAADVRSSALCIEVPRARAMRASNHLFDACLWAGRFIEVWTPRPVILVDRAHVKLALCGRSNARDSDVRARVLAHFGFDPKSRKHWPAAMRGLKADLWQALAIALAVSTMDFGGLEDGAMGWFERTPQWMRHATSIDRTG